MSHYLAQRPDSLFPSRVNNKLGKQLARMDAQALAMQHADQLSIARVEQAAARGLVGIAQLSSLEASLVRIAPHAEGRLRAAADAGAISIVGIVARSGF
ncbi:MAG TPA: hypothetical protein VFY36_05445 [Solirubrobacteraceae bacterium]|nr:hypothetical protein [Solirubrobacteraceae bacterium]